MRKPVMKSGLVTFGGVIEGGDLCDWCMIVYVRSKQDACGFFILKNTLYSLGSGICGS